LLTSGTTILAVGRVHHAYFDPLRGGTWTTGAGMSVRPEAFDVAYRVDMSRFTNVASIAIDPDQRDVVLSAYADYVSAVAEDDDVLAWEIGTDAEDENLLHIVASFANEAAYGRHMEAAATAAVMKVLQPAMVGSPTFVELRTEHVTRREGGHT